MSRLGRLLALAALLVVAGVPRGSAEITPIEDYARYQPQQFCNPPAKPGTTAFSTWLVKKYGGGDGGISRRCRIGGTSEHKEGRAFDWLLDARTAQDRARAVAFLTEVFAVDAEGNEDALARRMGIMYVIWNDHMWSSYDGFEKRDYLSSSCKTLSRCSRTLRHRDHMHISLSRPGGHGETSWYAGRLEPQPQ